MAQKVQLKRSSVVTNGAPKLPTTSQVEVGELTINFAEGYETLSTKNSNNNIATFSSDAVLDRKYISSGAVVSAVSAVSKTIEDNEYVIAQTFNDQNGRLLALENAGFLTGYTETDPTVPAWAKASTKPTYTAAEVGALPTGTTLDGIADGTTRKLSDYSLTGHTHSEYFPASGGVILGSSTSTGISAEGIQLNDDGGRYIEIIPSRITLHDNFGKNITIGNWDNGDIKVAFDETVYLDGRIERKNQYGGLLGTLYIPTGKTGEIAITDDIPTTAAEVGALSTATTYFDDVEYDSSTKRINFKKNNSVIDYVDATAFIKDGMVSSVTISNGNLVVSFNTDAGKEDITLALTQIFNPNNYYDKTTADGKFLSTATTIPNDSNLIHKTGNETVGPYANKLFNDSILRFSAVTDDAGILLFEGAFIRKEAFNQYESGDRPFDFIVSVDSNDDDISLQDVLNTKITSADTPTEASILSSGFTKNAITGVTINGTPASVSNGVATANVTGLPSVTSSDNGKVLMVSNGQWAPVMPVTVYSGNMAPDNVLGNNGDIYLQTS